MDMQYWINAEHIRPLYDLFHIKQIVSHISRKQMLTSTKNKGILRPIFCIDINTHIDRKWKIMQNLLKNYFFKMFKFLLTFFIDIITPVVLSTQIACDVMCVQHVIH